METIDPELISFAVFDGIPPQKEGEDPTVFWYYPEQTPINDQFNMVGLYLTFIWFSRDFRASDDIKFFQTDKTFCCFCHLGAQVYCTATFSSNDPSKYRYRTQQMKLFGKIFGIIFNKLERDKTTNAVDKNNEFAGNLVNFLYVFSQPPLLKRLTPSLDLWNACEGVLAIAKYSLTGIRSACFIYKDRLLHTSMHPSDALALYTSYKAKIKRLFSFAPPPKPNTFQWLTGLCQMEAKDPIVFLPGITMDEGMLFLIAIRYNDLVVFIALLMTKSLTKAELIPLGESLSGLLPKIDEQCNKVYNKQSGSKITAYRDDGMLQITQPLSIPNGFIAKSENTESATSALQDNEADFIRFCGQLDSDHWVFMEKDSNQTTIVDENAPNLPEATSAAVNFIRTANIG